MSDRQVPWITYIVIAANLVVFAIELASGASAFRPQVGDVLPLGGNYAPLTLNGEWWRIGASMFLHYGVIHVAMNMLCLYEARGVELTYGRLEFVAIYVVAGVLGGVGSVARSSVTVSAGASGAVFGVFGAYAAVLVLRRASIDHDEWTKRVRSLSTFFAINLLYGVQATGVDMTAHVVGLVAGFAVGALLLGKRTDAQRSMRAVIAIVAALGVSAAVLVALPKPTDIDGLLSELGKVESRCIDTFNAALADVKSGKLDDAAFADRIERDVIAPWHDITVRVAAVHDAPARVDRLFALLRTLTEDREREWQLVVRASRLANDDPARQAAFDEALQLRTRVDDDSKQLEAEVNALKR